MSRVWHVGLLVALLGLSVGCRSKKELDQTVDGLVEALRSGNYEAMRTLALEEMLSDDLSEAKFKVIAATLAQLGDLREKTMQGVEVKSGGIRTGRYELDFAKGNVQLELTTKNGKIARFEFTGDPIRTAQRALRDAQYKDFGVRSFQFLVGDAPNPRGSVYPPGGQVRFRFIVAGLTRKAQTYHARVDLVMLSPDGSEAGRLDRLVDAPVQAKDNEPPVVTVTGFVRPRGTGLFRLKFTVRDVLAPDRAPLEYSTGLTVE